MRRDASWTQLPIRSGQVIICQRYSRGIIDFIFIVHRGGNGRGGGGRLEMSTVPFVRILRGYRRIVTRPLLSEEFQTNV